MTYVSLNKRKKAIDMSKDRQEKFTIVTSGIDSPKQDISRDVDNMPEAYRVNRKAVVIVLAVGLGVSLSLVAMNFGSLWYRLN